MESRQKKRTIIVSAMKRMALSLISAALGIVICTGLVALYSTARSAPVNSTRTIKAFPAFFFYFGVVAVYFAFPGWVLALPAVLWFTEVRDRFWRLFVLGAAIGPVTLLLELSWHRELHVRGIGDLAIILPATTISAFSTLLYLWLLRRSQTREQRNG